MSKATAETAQYISHFEESTRELGARRETPIDLLRKDALARFSERGFPTMREEDWKYTDLAPLAKTRFRLAPPSGPNGLSREALEKGLGEGWGTRLVFLNGRFVPALSRAAALPPGVAVSSIVEGIAADPERVAEHLGSAAGHEDFALVALNTAFLRDGACVRVPDGVVVEDPIHLLFLSSVPGEPIVCHPRTLVVAGRNSQVTVVESYAALDGGVAFTNAVTEILAGEGSVVNHCKVERESPKSFHVATLAARVGRSSRFASHAVLIGGGLVRNDVIAVLGEEGASCALNGLYMAEGTQHMDNRTLIDHVRPHCASQETYKGVLDGKSRAVFNGEIIVRADAQKTDAHQINRNLVLSDEALVNTKPRLRILANDVKCTHGATVGMLDEDALFYLRSRGIEETAARGLLVYAFASDVIAEIPARPLRLALQHLVQARLPESMRGELT